MWKCVGVLLNGAKEWVRGQARALVKGQVRSRVGTCHHAGEPRTELKGGLCMRVACC